MYLINLKSTLTRSLRKWNANLNLEFLAQKLELIQTRNFNKNPSAFIVKGRKFQQFF